MKVEMRKIVKCKHCGYGQIMGFIQEIDIEFDPNPQVEYITCPSCEHNAELKTIFKEKEVQDV